MSSVVNMAEPARAQGAPRQLPWDIPAAGRLVLRAVDTVRQGVRALSVALLATAVAVPGIAALLTAAAYVAPLEAWPGLRWGTSAALPVGLLVTLVAWILVALFYGGVATASNANARSYDELSQRLRQLDAQLAGLHPAQFERPEQAGRRGQPPPAEAHMSDVQRIAYREACAHRDDIAGQLQSRDLRWVLATGYINLWNRMHRAEEALFDIQPLETVIRGARFDELRLLGSKIPGRNQLLRNIRQAVTDLSPGALQYFDGDAPAGGMVTRRRATRAAAAADAAPHTPGDPAPEARQMQARAILREVRRAINDFRDGRREGLVRARNHLTLTVAFTELGAFLLLALAVLVGAPRQAIVAAVAFFLVGAVVGLFNRLGTDAGTDQVVNDYGLARARLLHTPVFSGLAALGGVVVTALLPVALNFAVIAPQAPVAPPPAVVASAPAAAPSGATVAGSPPATATPAQPEPAPAQPAWGAHTLGTVFDLQQHPFGLILAAIFGLTPRLLIRQLHEQADQLKADLRSTKAPNTGADESDER